MATAVPTLAEIQAQIAKLQAQAEQLRQQEFENALSDVKAKIAAYGFTAKTLGLAPEGTRRAPVKAHRPPKPKYRSPDGTQTWSGRGRPPKWVAAHLAAGRDLRELAIR